MIVKDKGQRIYISEKKKSPISTYSYCKPAFLSAIIYFPGIVLLYNKGREKNKERSRTFQLHHNE